MKDPTRTPPAAEPGHYGAGYGEQVPPATVPQPPQPLVDTDVTAPAGLEPIDRRLAPDAPADAADPGDAPVVFTPEDVHARPPDQTPTDAAPESEKAGLLFERS